VLTVDTFIGGGAPLASQVYDPPPDQWESAGNTTALLVDVNSREIGPGVLRPDGTLIYTGGTPQLGVSLFDEFMERGARFSGRQ
jgi:hypothetical protein